MKVVNFGNTFVIYGDDLKTGDELPAGTYKVNFSPMQGFSLEGRSDFSQLEEKIYGAHPEKVDKILRTYNSTNRSIGVILSGNKGMGKSLTAQLLAEKFVAQGKAVIIIDKPHKGIADFLDEIEQEVLVLFDEFEKVFSNKSGNDSNIETQDALLGLFDGVSQQKRLYLITVNNLGAVNDFMINRPGRFHYHIRYDYPSSQEVREYLEDKLESEYHGEIEKVIKFANQVSVNYDSLRAIATELSFGYPFESAIRDLNILNTEREMYDITVAFSNGIEKKLFSERFNPFSSEQHQTRGSFLEGEYFHLEFMPKDGVAKNGLIEIPVEDVEIYLDSDYNNSGCEEGLANKQVNIVSVTYQTTKQKDLHYKL